MVVTSTCSIGQPGIFITSMAVVVGPTRSGFGRPARGAGHVVGIGAVGVVCGGDAPGGLVNLSIDENHGGVRLVDLQ